MDALKHLLKDRQKDYCIPECMNEENYISDFPKYSTECTGNSQDVKRLIAKIRRGIESGKYQLPDYFVGMGTSGMGLASVLSYEFDIPLVHIRKGQIDRHGGDPHEERQGYPNIRATWPTDREDIVAQAKKMDVDDSPYLGKTFWFVDDCIDSGTTFMQTIHITTMRYGMVCVGVGLTYRSWHNAWTLKKWAQVHRNAPFTFIQSETKW